MDASFSVGFTYGYSRCPASRDATHSTELTEGGSYLSAYGGCHKRRPRGMLTSRSALQYGAGVFQSRTCSRLRVTCEPKPFGSAASVRFRKMCWFLLLSGPILRCFARKARIFCSIQTS